MGHGRDHEIHVIHIGFGRREGRTVNDNSVAVGGLGGDRGDDVTVGGDMEAGRKRGAEGMVVGQVENGGVLVRGRRGVHDGRGFRRGVEVRPALSVGWFRVLQRVKFWVCTMALLGERPSAASTAYIQHRLAVNISSRSDAEENDEVVHDDQQSDHQHR